MRPIDADHLKQRIKDGAEAARKFMNPETYLLYLEWLEGLYKDIDDEPTAIPNDLVSKAAVLEEINMAYNILDAEVRIKEMGEKRDGKL